MNRKNNINKLQLELNALFNSCNDSPVLSEVQFTTRRLQTLRNEFQSIVNRMSQTDCSWTEMEEIVEKYASKYPIESFARWFIKWGQHLMRKYQIFHQNTFCKSHDWKKGCSDLIMISQPSHQLQSPQHKQRDKEAEFARDNKVIETILEEVEEEEVVVAAVVEEKSNQEEEIKKEIEEEKECNQPNKRVKTTEKEDNEFEIKNVKTEQQPSGIFQEFGKEVLKVLSPLDLA